jgi:APA family basic amino acid/polyamine antiporter
VQAIRRSKDTGRPSLARELGLFDTTSIVVGGIIGSAIFLIPNTVAAQLHSFGAVLLAWFVGGILSVFGALSLGELGAAFPRAGGLYVYLRKAYGPIAGFLYGWGLLTLIHTGSIASSAVGLSVYLAQLIPLSHSAQAAVSVSSILVLTTVNCVGIRTGKWVQNIFTIASVGGLILMTLLLLVRGPRLMLLAQGFARGSSLRLAWLPFGVALIAVLWAYEGWHMVSFAAGEVKDPTRNLPRGLLYGTLIMSISYILANVAYYGVLTPSEIRDSDAVAATAMMRALGPAATGFVSLVILLAVVGSMNATILAGPRVYYAMARDGLFFEALGRTSSRYRTPVIALIVQGVWASLCTFFGSYQQLFTAVIFTAWIFYGMAVAGVIVLRLRQPELARPFRVPGFPWVPSLFCLAAIGLTVNTVVNDPRRSALGIGLLLAGMVVYAFFRQNQAAGELERQKGLGDTRIDIDATLR